MMMRSIRRAAIVLGAGMALALSGSGTAMAGPPDRNGAPDAVVAGYYPAWSGVPVSDLPADRLTDILYSFAKIDDSGRCVLPHGDRDEKKLAALGELKEQHPQLRVEISIGGWGATGFSDAALTHKSRQRLVDSCIDLFFGKYGDVVDGIDLDWEFPVSGGPPELTYRPEDRRNFTLLAREFRHALDAVARERGEDTILAAAIPAGRLQSAGPYDPNESFELRKLGHVLDFVNLMTYNLSNGFSTVAGFNAPMRPDPADPTPPVIKRWNSVVTAVEYFERHGVPADKIVLGQPYFAEAFKVTSTDNDGLYQPVVKRTGAPSWTTIKTKLRGDPAWSQHWSSRAAAPWLFNEETKTFVTYENPRSISVRAWYAKGHNLRGVFTWALGQDDAQHSLFNAMSAPYS
ncbi:MAG: glycoside hydrolase family 18 protein [Streptosporangiales bacterium]